ncbi:MAG TPA: serine hydrolase domain-containing protein [Anaerolineae bacterium]
MEIVSPEMLGLSSQRLARIKPAMQRYVDAGKSAGAVTLVARHGKIAHLECVGHADMESGRVMNADTLFRIYSMTKPITSAAMMMLFEEGRFRLTDPLYAYVPAFKDMQVLTNDKGDTVPAARPITIRDLFTHTAGLGYGIGSTGNPLSEQMYQQNYWMPILMNNGLTLNQLMDGVARMPLVSQPGEKWIYSIGIDVLGLLVQVISGMSFAAYLKRNLFEPLGMVDTDFYVPQDKRARLATVYGPENKNFPLPPTPEELAGPIGVVNAMKTNGSFDEPTNTPSGGGGLVSSTNDYLTFCQMMLNKGTLGGVRLLGRKTVEYMFTNQLRAGQFIDDGFTGFGLGGSVILETARAQRPCSVGTWSWGGAANTTFWVDPVEDLIGIFMTQFIPPGTHPIADDFANLVYQSLVD